MRKVGSQTPWFVDLGQAGFSIFIYKMVIKIIVPKISDGVYFMGSFRRLLLPTDGVAWMCPVHRQSS